MNKVYFFTEKDADTGVFIGAMTWREARKIAFTCDEIDCEFIDVEGHICKIDQKPVLTEVNGKMECDDLLKSGYEDFYWEYGKCEKCCLENGPVYPSEGRMICYECREIERNGQPV
ncbi:hypothetical protein [Desulfosporosinus metallidurans]|uniref:Uncharacterized protein n=1 Tax=Desulfosporosinus metallidurans TaxID=1888891 RepID=A0A1Q8QRJ3_9FIRM|nr:hypothetical protein [Desulfosporosinus metallidurans]OLN29930.1 hypothetical protein DSOL_3270 [Desulfosporosinus metallidurans]